MKICIDAGHGGADSGAVNGTRLEKIDNLIYAKELEKQFKEQNCEVVMTRIMDNYLTLAQRTNMANNEKCDVFISCHRNAFTASTANGVEIWLHSKAPQSYKNWATNIVNNTAKIGMTNRGVKLGYTGGAGEYAVNRDTLMPSMLIELGFISSEVDNIIFNKSFAEICKIIVRETMKFLGLVYKDPTVIIPVEPPEHSEPVIKSYKININDIKKQGFDKIEFILSEGYEKND